MFLYDYTFPWNLESWFPWPSQYLSGADAFHSGQWQGKPITHAKNDVFSVKLEAIHLAMQRLHAI